jgi:hypothetical protein
MYQAAGCILADMQEGKSEIQQKYQLQEQATVVKSDSGKFV